LNCLIPVIVCILAFIKPKIPQWLDNGFSGNIYKTKKKSILQLKELYRGDEFKIAIKYSDSMLVWYIAMMYGLGMPLLFPLAGLSSLLFWVCERIQVAYALR